LIWTCTDLPTLSDGDLHSRTDALGASCFDDGGDILAGGDTPPQFENCGFHK